MNPKTKTDEEIISQLEPSLDEVIDRKLKNLNFAKVMFWLCNKAHTSKFVYTSELSKFLKVTSTRSYQILRELSDLGLLSRQGSGSVMMEYHFVNNSTKPLILNYLNKTKKRLESYI